MKFLLILLSLAFISACSERTENKCPCYVKIPQLQKDGTYKLEVVQLKTLEDPKRISSSKIKITINPHFQSNGSVSEFKPRAQYILNENNVMIPQGSNATETAEMFSLYKTMEDLYFFDKSIGVDKILTYPRVVSLQTRVLSGNRVNDAYYMQDYDRIVFLKYLGSKVPLSLNPGIIAHEHSHAIFNKIIKPTETTVNSLNKVFLAKRDLDENLGYNFLILKALDEGIADFWANLHTGLVNPYLASYSEEEKMEGRVVIPHVVAMDEPAQLFKTFNYQKFKEQSSQQSNSMTGEIYGKAVMYSNLLKSISEKLSSGHEPSNREARNREIGTWIVESLQRLSKVVDQKGKSTILSQSDILDSFNPPEEDQETRAKICDDLDLFLTFHPKVPSCSSL